MSDSVQPQRRQPTRLHRPWDSPGKNTGVGCHVLLQCMKVKSESEVAQSCPIRSDPMDCSLPGSSVHGIFPGESIYLLSHVQLFVDPMDCSLPGSSVHGISQARIRECRFLLQRIFLTQGSNPRLLHWQADFLLLSHQGSTTDSITVSIFHALFFSLF